MRHAKELEKPYDEKKRQSTFHYPIVLAAAHRHNENTSFSLGIFDREIGGTVHCWRIRYVCPKILKNVLIMKLT
jgi:hypothetical protein